MKSSASLYQDTRGAVMLTGLFMSTFLIGSLWFVMGVGDATVFRDKMQEATDHGAFSAAALHAKGMNFIALLNLVMLVGTIIHIVLGIISDIKFALAVACAFTVYCWPALPAKVADWWAAYDRWDTYFNLMAPAFRMMHNAQKIASYAYPALSVANAYQVGRSYGGDARTGNVNVVALSTSLIPGGGANGSNRPTQQGAFNGQLPSRGGSWKKIDFSDFSISSTMSSSSDNNGGGKEGLPVEAKEFSDLCMKVVQVTANGLLSMFGVSGYGGRAGSVLGKLLGMGLKFRYCNSIHIHVPPLGPGFDRLWGEDGPYIVYKPAENGNMWFQVWAFNMDAKLTDNNESKVAMAKSKQALIPVKYSKEEKGTYFAQAEFYFDCKEEWKSTFCNGDDLAMYAINWRARLKRVDLGNLLSGVVGGALNALAGMGQYTQFKDAKVDQLVGGMLNGMGGGLFDQNKLGDFMKVVVGQGEDWVKDQVDPGRTPSIGGIYH